MKEKIKALKDDIEVIIKSLGLVKDYLSKHYLLINTAQMTLRTVSPYITVYCTGLVITALTRGETFSVMLKYVLIAAISTLISDMLTRWLNFHRLTIINSCYVKHCAVLSRKALSLNYAKAESASVQTLRGKIEETANNGDGIAWVADMAAEITANILSVIVALYMVSGLAVGKATKPLAGAMKFVDTPYFTVLLACVTVICIVITVKFQSIAEKKNFKSYNSLKCWPLKEHYDKKYLNETDSGKDVRIYNEAPLLNEELRTKIYGPITKNAKEHFKIWVTYGSVTGIISNVLGGAVYIFVGLKAFTGAFGVGKVVEYYGAITKLINSCSDIAGCFGYLRANCPKMRQELEYLALTSDMENGTRKADEIDTDNLEFEFHNVSFRYPETEPLVLKNVSLKITQGEHLAVVGMNGSGKSTMIKLLARLYDPDEGHITVNGIDIREFDHSEYLKLFSIVFQDFKLLAFSVGENIACSDNYDEQKVWSCLEMAGVHDRVKEFPNGLKQTVYKLYEKDGVDLSGGEEQKLAIARALYKNGSFVVLDEPTAALDPIAESEIYSKFNEIVGKKTAIYISHRLSSCRFCSRIVVFDKGNIIQQGTHEELLAETGGKYYQLWNAQAQYYAKNGDKTAV